MLIKALDGKPHVITSREVDSKRAVLKKHCNAMVHVKTRKFGPGIGEQELNDYFEREFGFVIME